MVKFQPYSIKTSPKIFMTHYQIAFRHITTIYVFFSFVQGAQLNMSVFFGTL